jgi:hypothetical protein
MQTEYVKRTEIALRIQKRDSMGRSPQQVEAMEANDPRPLKLSEATKHVHALVEEACGDYPKCLYKLAMRKGVPAGDVANPDYPLPLDAAIDLGLDEVGFKVVGKNRQDGGHVVVRLPWITKLVGVLREDLTVDLKAAQEEERNLLAKGWVDHPSKLKGLPVPHAEQPFDDEPNGTGRTGKAA